jgi:hypothetical protein
MKGASFFSAQYKAPVAIAVKQISRVALTTNEPDQILAGPNGVG